MGRGIRAQSRCRVVLDQEHPGEWYRPFLTPPLAVMVHWQRAADGTVPGLLGYRERDVAPEIACEFAVHLGRVAVQLAHEPALRLGEIELITPVHDILPLTGGLAPSRVLKRLRIPPAPRRRDGSSYARRPRPCWRATSFRWTAW